METNISEPHIPETKRPELAGIGYRFLANLLDGMIMGIPLSIMGFFFMSIFFIASPESMIMMAEDSYSATYVAEDEVAAIIGLLFFYLIIFVISIVIMWLYYALMESSKCQGTLGKMAVGIKVTKVSGERLTFARASGRYFSKALLSPILYIGYIITFFTEKKQALHDLIASTIVVNK
ncbi:RDD family protein [Bacillus sp. NPDC077027]|uniref:RDD family protein n=1 Tax=Bacillus sp. NPDC077027 TaxID=3390548 RepID=UPI003D032825